MDSWVIQTLRKILFDLKRRMLTKEKKNARERQEDYDFAFDCVTFLSISAKLLSVFNLLVKFL